LGGCRAKDKQTNKQTFYEYEDSVRKFDVHESVHRDTFMKMTNKMHFFFQALNFF
jgi:hypothetical protein